MEISHREAIIVNYLHAYNTFDVEGMVAYFDVGIVFTNYSNGEINLKLDGVAAFRAQAEQAKTFFSERTQSIKSFQHHDNKTEVEINYQGILAIDLPNGLKKGDNLRLEGKSIFTFSGDKVTELIDIS